MMFPVVLVLLVASAAAQTGPHRYVMGQWVLTDEGQQFEEMDSQAEEAVMTTETPAPEEDHDVTPEPPATKDPDDDDIIDGEFLVWKVLLVALVLLMASVGSLGFIYYLCVWRGGRIHYRPHKVVYT